jgi:hypothetical protein
VVVPTPKAEAPAFEVVEDEPPAKPSPRPKARAVADDDDRPRKRRAAVEYDDEDDERPRKSKKKAAADNSMMTRNIIGGVVLLALLGVAGWVYYDKFGKKDDDTAGETGATPPADRASVQGVRGSDMPGGGEQGGHAVWTPDPALVNELNQKGVVGAYQISLPQRFTPVQVPVDLPPDNQSATWVAKSASGEPAAIVLLAVHSDANMLGNATKNMRQSLVNFSAGVADTAEIRIDTRGPTETGLVNGLRFTRFAFSGAAPNQDNMRGVVYGVVDGDFLVILIGMGFGAAAEAEIEWLESMAATTRRRSDNELSK